jgi:glutamine cyclotransferase
MYQRFPVLLTILITLVIVISGITIFFVFKEDSSNNTSLFDTESDAYTVIERFPHDPDAFTQGLAIDDGIFYEGTGLYGSSSIRKFNLETGEILQSRELLSEYFGEGITVYDNYLIQLTWRSGIGFVYETENFELLTDFNYSTEGWGLTFTGDYLVMSDGTENLYFLDPQNFTKVYSIQVHYKDLPIPRLRLNELEYIKGEIYANLFPTDYIIRIDPSTGSVNGWLNLTGLMDREHYEKKLDVLNGIAFDENANRLFVTGKYWPYIFELNLFVLT